MDLLHRSKYASEEERALAFKIVQAFSDALVKSLVRSIRHSLQQDTGLVHPSLDGVDHADFYGLRDLWDKICVLSRTMDSAYWECYEDRVQSEALKRVKKLKYHEQQCLWMCTDEFEADARSDFYQDDVEIGVPYLNEVACYVRDEVLREARHWENERIRKNEEHW